MTNAFPVIENVCFDHERLRVIAGIFDEVWASIKASVGSSGRDIEAARDNLAELVLHLARDGQLDERQLRSTVSRLAHERAGKTAPSDC